MLSPGSCGRFRAQISSGKTGRLLTLPHPARVRLMSGLTVSLKNPRHLPLDNPGPFRTKRCMLHRMTMVEHALRNTI
ncbi:hypothetical protein BN2476_470130 [Paraburkholderia piptadeniae]|uniref:Uncharacterized protein n=1 Tax=Paraburkholderia piptadeniae TaxID=1701573 RepID=A0A1N7SEG1_9BURK|nr:hypothetical protein BN2476_470130 [Paraburkholderia piptadeniae]